MGVDDRRIKRREEPRAGLSDPLPARAIRVIPILLDVRVPVARHPAADASLPETALLHLDKLILTCRRVDSRLAHRGARGAIEHDRC